MIVETRILDRDSSVDDVRGDIRQCYHIAFRIPVVVVEEYFSSAVIDFCRLHHLSICKRGDVRGRCERYHQKKAACTKKTKPDKAERYNERYMAPRTRRNSHAPYVNIFTTSPPLFFGVFLPFIVFIVHPNTAYRLFVLLVAKPIIFVFVHTSVVCELTHYCEAALFEQNQCILQA